MIRKSSGSPWRGPRVERFYPSLVGNAQELLFDELVKPLEDLALNTGNCRIDFRVFGPRGFHRIGRSKNFLMDSDRRATRSATGLRSLYSLPSISGPPAVERLDFSPMRRAKAAGTRESQDRIPPAVKIGRGLLNGEEQARRVVDRADWRIPLRWIYRHIKDIPYHRIGKYL